MANSSSEIDRGVTHDCARVLIGVKMGHGDRVGDRVGDLAQPSGGGVGDMVTKTYIEGV